jgi:hypothetical protein
MKKLLFVLAGFVILVSISCNKSNNDTDVTYTTSYLVTSLGDVTMDTIMYMDANGDEKYEMGTSSLNMSFETKNGYHAKLYLSGTTNKGSCGILVGVEKVGESGYIKFAVDSTSSTTPQHFTFHKEFYSLGK